MEFIYQILELVKRLSSYFGLANNRQNVEDVFYQLLYNKDYDGALKLAHQHKYLDVDVVYKCKWRSSGITVQSIDSVLGSIKDKLWAINECARTVPISHEACSTLIEFGLELANLRPPDDYSDDQLEELRRCRQDLLRHQHYLLAYESILGDSRMVQQHFDHVFYDEFRQKCPFNNCLDFAHDGDCHAVNILLNFYTESLEPHLLAILSNLPETQSPYHYRDLLPSIDDNGHIVYHWKQSYDDQQQTSYSETLSDSLREADDQFENEFYVENKYLYKYRKTLTSGLLSEWFKERALEMESRTLLLTNAIQLLHLGSELNIENLRETHDDLLEFDRIVYDCCTENNIYLSFSEFNLMDQVDRLALMTGDSIKNCKDRFRFYVLPYIQRRDTKLGLEGKANLLREYFRKLAHTREQICRTIHTDLLNKIESDPFVAEWTKDLDDVIDEIGAEIRTIERSRQAKQLSDLAGKTMALGELDECYETCKLIMLKDHKDCWPLCCQLGMHKQFKNNEAKYKLLAFALAHCDDADGKMTAKILENVIELRKRDEKIQLAYIQQNSQSGLEQRTRVSSVELLKGFTPNREEVVESVQTIEMLADIEPLAPELFWILCLAFVIAFLLAFSVGANDVSNSFGTSVGSKVLTVTQACVLATFFEVAGATLLGYSVCDTFRRKLYDVDLYKDSQKELMLGALACLMGSAAWNLIATAFKMPISGTHSIVGATLGFSIVLRGWSSIKWMGILKIVASWVASPILSGFISSMIYLLISKTIIRKLEPLEYGLKALPFFYGATIFINIGSVVIGGPEFMGLNKLKWYAGLCIALMFAAVTICCVALLIVPRMRRKILDEIQSKVVGNPMVAMRRVAKPEDGKSASVHQKIAAFDNAAFKSDKDEQELDKQKELSLNVKDLSVSHQNGEQKATKPPITPKPAHLMKRQEAQDKQMEEIDLATAAAASGDSAGTRQTDRDLEKATTTATRTTRSGSRSSNFGNQNTTRPEMIRGERFEVFRLFSSLQILTACFASFAHGTNDVSNAVAPLVPIWNIYTTGFEDIDRRTQIWILAFGGIGICTGLWAWGRAVMSTVGTGLCQLTPSKGFAIELGAAISVLCATKLSLPISTTHCKVGSVVIVGLVSSRFCSQDNLLDISSDGEGGKEAAEAEAAKQGAVDWKLFGNIAITWIITVPLAALASALIMVILKWLLLDS